ncbi:HNH endonuclease [Alcaligenes endophyticus]|uniref:HNH endonuclease n=1 Tax=Alcaligenes endophyticus TaxID=1929088 RepID=A0ABT8EKA8_9BURK|nr:HNH endonuclease signature motif containing protein [Alcaligenes endophyticus]MCX5592036.1 HNH endonuclease signature motif containing protein [Alcaligenes endophyticus]MDN4121726.1 HNH endonuclease [Alcaligenes endophyticus]
MTKRIQTPCRVKTCRRPHRNQGGYCDDHIGLASGWRAPERGSSSERGYGAAWRRKRKIILGRDYHQCRPCAAQGLVTYGNEVDHIIPKAEGGTDSLENLQTICNECHKKKTRKESNRRRVGGV